MKQEEQNIKSNNPWVIAVKKLLNLTDEAKLEKFHALMVKKYQKDIANNIKKKIAVAETNKKINKNKNLFFIIIQKKTSSN